MTTVRIAEVRDATRRFWICTVTGSDPDGTDFTGGPEFDGSRWNDLHYTRQVKEQPRESQFGAMGSSTARGLCDD